MMSRTDCQPVYRWIQRNSPQIAADYVTLISADKEELRTED